MRRRLVGIGLLLAAIATVTAFAAPAGAAPSELEIVEIDTSRHPEISLVLSGSAFASGAPEVMLTEDGRPMEVEVERIVTGALEVVLVLDTSGSMAGFPIEAARSAARRFVERMPSGVRVAVVGFGASPRVAQGFTTDKAPLLAAIDQLGASGETALYDAVLTATTLYGDPRARRAMVVLSDGGDTVSASALEPVVARLAATKAAVTVVELATAETDRAALDAIAGAGSDGSGVLQAGGEELLAAYEAVAADLVARHRVRYRTDTGGPVTLEITLAAGDASLSTTKAVRYPGSATVAAAPGDVITTRAPEPGVLGSKTALPVGIALLMSSFAIVGLRLFRARPTAVRLVASAGDVRPLHDLAERASSMADRALEGQGRRGRIDTALEQAGISMRAGEAVVLVLAAAVGALLVGGLLAGPALGLLLAIAVLILPRLGVGFLRDRRHGRFADQVDPLLQMIAGSLRAGYAFMQAVEGAAAELESPAADELRRVTTEVRLGRDVVDALERMSERMQNEDLRWVVQAVRIQREVGGDLADVLDRVSETIRERDRLRRQVKALSAEGRISAIVLFLLPVVLAFLMHNMNPGYLGALTGSLLGFVMVGVAAILLVAGGLWLRYLVRPVY